MIYTSPGKGVFVNKTDLSVIHRETEKILTSALEDAKNAGMDKNEVIHIVNSVWEGRS